MQAEHLTLQGQHVRLEPLGEHHADALVAAALQDPSLYRWSHVPRNRAEAAQYIATALAWQRAGSAVPFVTIRARDGEVVGSTRFWNLERWSWPPGHSLHGRLDPDVCEIGYTWLARSAVRTAVNTEAKALMLTHAFERWQVQSVCLHTDARNEASRTAMERIGARFEGILRAHRLAADYTARDSARFAITRHEWPAVQQRLRQLLTSK
ncbi:MAG TPA: GNAT family N-acetyltransferase [Steroidobacteraceae bacterium]